MTTLEGPETQQHGAGLCRARRCAGGERSGRGRIRCRRHIGRLVLAALQSISSSVQDRSWHCRGGGCATVISLGIAGAIVRVGDVHRTEVESSGLDVPVQINDQPAEAYGDEVRKACFESLRIVYAIRMASSSDMDAWKTSFVDGRLSSDIPVGLGGVSEPGASREQYLPETWGPRTGHVVRRRWDCMKETCLPWVRIIAEPRKA